MNEHIVKSYEDELNTLTADCARMGGLTEAQVGDALDAPDAPAYRVLADMYADHPGFRARYEGRATGFADYLVAAMRAFAESRLS